ncbi:S-adenosyl-L-methionine-dependent methyltransferase [Zopfochytrium polystomum]|nr:S-adenosyl-L-methionine-dependent methyltransferase [Zopfochytrium polystomum]
MTSDPTTAPASTTDLAVSRGEEAAAAAAAHQPQLQQQQQKQLYVLPSDAVERDRLTLQHTQIASLFGGIFHAPVAALLERGGGDDGGKEDAAVRVLDMGCGGGVWTREMAAAFPKTEFVGADIMSYAGGAVFESDPPNLRFVTENVVTGTSFPDHHFDLTFQRLLFLGIPSGGWDATLKELVRVTKPGGYIEFVETDMEIYDAGPILRQFNLECSDAVRKLGVDPFAGRTIATLVRNTAGLEVVDEASVAAPVWAGAGAQGAVGRANLEAALVAAKTHMARLTGAASEAEFEARTRAAFDECGVDTYKAYYKYYRVVARVA